MPQHPPDTPSHLYVLDDAGARWRVHDVVVAHGKFRRVALGARHANARVFVNQAGVRRLVMLAGDRRLGEETVRAQLRGAGYLPTTPFVPVTDPR